MTSALDWSHDFCLACDRQISEGAYCSQACRLADLEKPSSSEGLNFSASSAAASASTPRGHAAGSGLRLPPAVNFAAYKGIAGRADSPPGSPNYYSTSYYSYFAQNGSTQANATSPASSSSSTVRGLTTSSSRSSLSSISSTQSGQGLSAKTANELRGYVSSFDQVRDIKRRLTYA